MTTTLWILLGVAALVLARTGLLQAALRSIFAAVVGALNAICRILILALRYALAGLSFVLSTTVSLVRAVFPYRRQTINNIFRRVTDIEQKQLTTDRKIEYLRRIWTRLNDVETRINGVADTVGLEDDDDSDGGFSVSATDGELAKINDGFEALCNHLGLMVKTDSDGTFYVRKIGKVVQHSRKSTR